MKKIKYYFENKNGEKTLARTSANDYTWALIQTYKDGVEHCIKCSCRLDIIERELKYLTAGFGYKFEEKVNGKCLWSNQFHDPKDFRIVKLIKD